MRSAKRDPPNPAEKFDPRNPKPSASFTYHGKPLPSSDSLIPNPLALFDFQYPERFFPNNPRIEQKESSAPSSSEMAEEQKEASAPSSSEMAEEQKEASAPSISEMAEEQKVASAPSISEMAEEQKEASAPSISEMAEEKEKERNKYLFCFPEDPNYNPFPVTGGPVYPSTKKWPTISLNVPTIPDPKNPVPKPALTDFTCEICGGAHFRSFCSYWIELPENPHIIFDSTSPYEIVCECSWPIVNDACSHGRCPPNRPRRIAEKYMPMYPPM